MIEGSMLLTCQQLDLSGSFEVPSNMKCFNCHVLCFLGFGVGPPFELPSSPHISRFGSLVLFKLAPQVAEQAGMGISLFERWAVSYSHNGISSPVSLLAQQYRMHPAISHFSREHFYGGRVKDHPSVLERISCVLSHEGPGGPGSQGGLGVAT